MRARWPGSWPIPRRGCAWPVQSSPTPYRRPVYRSNRCRQILATGSADFAALLAGPAATHVPADPQAEAWLFYTSGTTGRPKGAVLTHRNLLFACHCYYADIDFIGPQDTMLHAAPLTHGAGLYGLAHLARGSHNVILSGSFDPERVLDAFATLCQRLHVCGADHGVAAHQPRRDRLRPTRAASRPSPTAAHRCTWPT